MEAAVNPKLTADRFRRDLLRRLGEKGIAYVPELNTVFALTFQLPDAAEEASRCLRAAWSGTVGEAVTESASADDYFYRAVLEEALIHFGSRVLYPAKKPIHDSDLYHAYARSREEIENAGRSYADYMEMIDFIVLHRDYESNLRQYWYRPELLQTGLSFTGEKFTFVTHTLGQLLGTGLYEAYVAGRVTKRSIRSLFCRRFNEPGVARTAYFVTARRIRGGKVARRRLAA
jgi:hypothetical protein